jgi:two-component system chemotaxis response regulator CheB
MPPELVVIGCSWGGLDALARILSVLDPDFPAAVAVAQHRLPGTADSLAGALQSNSTLPVVDVGDKTAIVPGNVYLAPSDYHLIVERDSFALSTGEPVMYARPSIDVLFESAAAAYGDAVIAVILTGANEDGAAGAAAVKSNGGLVIVQDPTGAVRPEMPSAALLTSLPDAVLDLDNIGPRLNELCQAVTGARQDG